MFSDAIKSSILDLTSNDKSLERPQLIKAVSEKLQDTPISGGGVVAVVDRHLQQSPNLRTFEREGKTLVFDSNSVAKMELEVGKIVDRLVSTPGFRLDNATVDRASIPSFAKNANKADRFGPEAMSRVYDTIALVPADLRKPTLTIDKKAS